MVQFRAVVTPCIPTCEPMVCDVLDFGGQMKQAESYGRKKRDVVAHFTDFGSAYIPEEQTGRSLELVRYFRESDSGTSKSSISIPVQLHKGLNN